MATIKAWLPPFIFITILGLIIFLAMPGEKTALTWTTNILLFLSISIGLLFASARVITESSTLATLDELAKTGEERPGTLLEVNNTRVRISDRKKYEVTVEIEGPDNSTYQLETLIFPPPFEGEWIYEGNKVRVRVDPQDSQRVAVEGPWERVEEESDDEVEGED